jgi:sulfate/thiosulfate transport system substrate-binding protein
MHIHAIRDTEDDSMQKRTRGRLRPALTLLAASAALVATAALSACGGSASGSGKPLALVAFSVPKPAYDELQASFAKTSDGKGTKWTSSYGASGDQARAVIAGLKADYVGFSLTSDMTKLVDKGLVAKDWNAGPQKGIVSSSVVVIAFRKGNPKHITGWADLVKPGIKIVTPNPGSSGSARWNILAAYAQAAANGGDAAGTQYLTSFYKNVVSLPASGREATSAFVGGTGDVLISYENEAIAARQNGQAVEYVVPSTTIKIENPGAVTAKANGKAKDFLTYIESKAGQEIFAKHGFRPVDTSVSVGTVQGANDPAHPFPTVGKLVTIAELGGWSAVSKKFFDETTGLVTKIQAASKVS